MGGGERERALLRRHRHVRERMALASRACAVDAAKAAQST
jgi:hypothetical protein